ncbi:cationic amino acid transporter 3-like [Haliotis rufescens]|uniref:cationic amino acid transporter 3-like n=1 Tax=Haliotis rufescens TaxID=6454 RepID=UPI001EB05341|nr:cationic amino acid transporter 3-like [Haliotis rufescens]
MRTCRGLLDAVSRRKLWDTRSLHDTKYKRCLNVVDLIGIGTGSSAGLGVYVLSAYIARAEAGPSAVLSVLLGGVSALLSGVCHAELAARFPRAGSSYVYSYSTFGELCAFITGWNLLLEHVLGAAVAAKAWSGYVDYMLNDTVNRYMSDTVDWSDWWILDTYPDVLASSISLLATLFLVPSVRVYSVINFILICLAGLFVLSFICVGFFHVETHNWTKSPGFFPHGVRGMTSGAAVLIYAFTGVDNVATSGEETKNACRTIPTAIVASIMITFVVYFGATTSLTLAFPWVDLSDKAALAKAYEGRHIFAAKYVIGVGAVFGLSAAILGSLYPLSRILHAMCEDGLLPRGLSRVNSSTQTPIVGILILGLFSAGIALIVAFDPAIEMLSIASLTGYFLSALNVLCLRYHPDVVGVYREYTDPEDSVDYTKQARLCETCNHPSTPRLEVMMNGDLTLHYTTENRFSNSSDKPDSCQLNGQCKCANSAPYSQTGYKFDSTERSYLKPETNRSSLSLSSLSSLIRLPSYTCLDPDESTWRSTRHSILTYLISSVFMCVSVIAVALESTARSWWAITLACISAVFMVTSSLFIAKQPQNKTKLYFQTPYVPFVPLLSMLISMILLSALSSLAWTRFALWMLLGLMFYCIYGVRNSAIRHEDDQEVVLYDVTNPTFNMNSIPRSHVR